MFGSRAFGHLLIKRPMVALDIGARGGFVTDLLPIASAVDAVGFEPDKAECERLNRDARDQSSPWRSLRVLPTALARRAGERDLYITRRGGTSSMLSARPEIGRTFMRENYFVVEQTVKVDAMALDDAVTHFEIGDPVFMKVDVEGMEKEVFDGGTRVLGRVLAVRTEVAFQQTRVNQPLYHEVDDLLRSHGLVPFGFIELHHWRRTTRQKHPLAGARSLPFSRGQLIHGDMVYFRSPCTMDESNSESIDRFVQLSALALCYDFVDEAAAILCRDSVSSALHREGGIEMESMVKSISRNLAAQFRQRRGRERWRGLKSTIDRMLTRR